MGDFVQKSVTKTAVRELAAPIESIPALNTIVASIISGNPWGCTAYEIGSIPQSGKRFKGLTVPSGSITGYLKYLYASPESQGGVHRGKGMMAGPPPTTVL